VKHAHEELGHRLAALRADFAALGARAAGAADALAATLPPPVALLEELTAARDAFAGLRTALLEQAAGLALVVDDEQLGTLRDLEPVLSAIAAAEERRGQLAAWHAACEEARGVLARVLALTHREEKRFAALAECQSRARELHAALAGPVPDDLDQARLELTGSLRPYGDLLALADGWNVLDDDRCALLQDAVTQSFGRALGLAALRGKLGREGDTPAAAPRARGRASTAPLPAISYPRAVAPAPPPAPAAAAEAADPPPAPVPAAPPSAAAPAAATAATSVIPRTADIALAPETGAMVSSIVVEIRQSGDAVSMETPQDRREREEQLEQLAQETARWWIAARDAWTSLRERGLGVAEAAPDYLRRFPHLLSVPLQKSAEGGSRLAEGYALLLAHIEKQEEGFVKEALARLNPQLSARGREQSYSLGQELYLYIVAEGRLYKTYPDFVREVLAHTIPEPGLWVQGGIVESDDETRLFTRGATAGSTEEQTRALTGTEERQGPHLFSATVGPLTTRVFTLRPPGPTLADPPDVEIKLRDNDAPSDRAWLVTLPGPGQTRPPAPRRHRTGGTILTELGRAFGGVWIAVFNPDPSSEHRYDLSIGLRRTPPQADPTQPAPPTPAASKFFGRKR
jgi:hypothetical protein